MHIRQYEKMKSLIAHWFSQSRQDHKLNLIFALSQGYIKLIHIPLTIHLQV
jgi:hypothetical protein